MKEEMLGRKGVGRVCIIERRERSQVESTEAANCT